MGNGTTIHTNCWTLRGLEERRTSKERNFIGKVVALDVLTESQLWLFEVRAATQWDLSPVQDRSSIVPI